MGERHEQLQPLDRLPESEPGELHVADGLHDRRSDPLTPDELYENWIASYAAAVDRALNARQRVRWPRHDTR